MIPNINEKHSDAVLLETQEMFQSQGMSILGEGYKEIATNPVLFESYIDTLTQGVSAGNVENMKALMRNSNNQILTESSVTGIAPIASLSMPVIRKLWPKFALKDAVKEEVAKSPRFVISYTKPYMFRGDGNGNEEKIYLPMGLKDKGVLTAAGRKEVVKRTVALSEAAPVADIDFTLDEVSAVSGAVTAATGSAKVASSASNVRVQPLDRDFHIAAYTVNGGESTHRCHEVLDINNTLLFEIEQSTGDVATILIRVDLKGAQVKVAGINVKEAITLDLVAPLSTEYNELSWSVSFDIERRDVQIPTGQHLNAPLPIEALQDMMAIYQIDATKETTDLMTNVFAMKLDMDVLEFIRHTFENQPGKYYEELPGFTDYSFSFDCRPAAGYAGGPKEWREQLKPQIDYLAQKIKNNTYLNTGIFVIVANPLDAQLIANVDWQFRGGQGAVDGVDVDYSVGTYVGANNYRIISSVNVAQGAMYLVFLPSANKQMTVKYYPYSFCVEHGYIDPNRSRVPSIMMTKRHTFESMLPAIGLINIMNNDGQGMFNSYVNVNSNNGWNDTAWDQGN